MSVVGYFAMVANVVRLWVKGALGLILNRFGMPGFVADCNYDATICNAQIEVRRYPLFTIIRLNKLDIYFCRLTGAIDGVGFSPNADCRQSETLGSVDSALQLADCQVKAQT